jgi:hypothetical protein
MHALDSAFNKINGKRLLDIITHPISPLFEKGKFSPPALHYPVLFD